MRIWEIAALSVVGWCLIAAVMLCTVWLVDWLDRHRQRVSAVTAAVSAEQSYDPDHEAPGAEPQ